MKQVPVKAPKVKIDNTQLLADTGLRVRHFGLVDKFGYPRNRALTVAYKEGHSNLEFATAVVHPSDNFCRKVGTKLAVESFLAGKTVRVPKMTDFLDTGGDKPRVMSACATLGQMFG